MQVQVQKWRNSLAIRIPKALAKETNIDRGSVVDLSLFDGKLIATPLSEEKYSLAQLLEKVTNENIHEEIDTGDAVGKENLVTEIKNDPMVNLHMALAFEP